jgi:hypothetical protein
MSDKKGLTTNFFHPSLLLLFLDLGSEIRDPEWVEIRFRDLGQTSRIRNTDNKTVRSLFVNDLYNFYHSLN